MSPVVDKATDDTQNQLDKLKSFVKDHWMGIATTLTAVSASITAAFYKCTEAAMVQEDALNDLVAAMQKAGTYTPIAEQELVDYARALQGVTKYGDEAIISIEANLQGYGMTVREVRAATKATLDLAAAKKIDLWAASELVGKAFAGETGTLSRYGLILGDNIPKTEKFAAVLALINEKYGDRAQRDAETYRGKMIQLSNAYGDLKEAIGGAITKSDAMNNSLDMFKGFIEGLTNFIEQHPAVTKIILIAGAITAVAGALGTLALILAKVAPIIAGLGGTAALTALMVAAPVAGTALVGGGGGWMLGNYILSGGTNLFTRDNAWEENAATAEADRLRKEAEDEQKVLLAKLQAKKASMSAGGPSDQVSMSQSLQEIRDKVENDDISARIAKLERDKELHQMGYNTESNWKNTRIADQQFKEASSNSLQNQFNQQEEADYEAWAKEQEERQTIQLENFEVTKTKMNEFYGWMESRSREASIAAQANFSSYFFDMFTGKILNLKDLWKGFCDSIWNAWAQTMANMAAQKMTTALFGSLFGGSITAGWSGEQMTWQTMQGVANSPFMAEGGVLNRPTFTLAGEAGPEAFVPLSRGRSIPVEMRGGGGSGQSTQNVTINIVNPLDGDSVKRMLAKEKDTIAGIIVRDHNDRGQVYNMFQNRR